MSRRIDSKTSRVSYQASVSFENVSFRSKYRHDIQGALDHHIVPWCIRTLGIGDTGIQKLRTPKRFRKVQIITISIQSCRMLLFDLFGDN